jgi:hypothetical protein
VLPGFFAEDPADGFFFFFEAGPTPPDEARSSELALTEFARFLVGGFLEGGGLAPDATDEDEDNWGGGVGDPAEAAVTDVGVDAPVTDPLGGGKGGVWEKAWVD